MVIWLAYVIRLRDVIARCAIWFFCALMMPTLASANPKLVWQVSLLEHKLRALDGDTLEGDLNGDQHINHPQERIRLLFVDTPELSKSHKGKDRLHGLPARAFAQQWLHHNKHVQLVNPFSTKHDRYGRTLAVVSLPTSSPSSSLNRALIVAGHSFFETRYQRPTAYESYVQAEADAFAAKRGIWQHPQSRARYLRRLKKWSKKAPFLDQHSGSIAQRFTLNTLISYLKVHPPQAIHDRFIQLQAQLGRVHTRRSGWTEIRFQGTDSQALAAQVLGLVHKKKLSHFQTVFQGGKAHLSDNQSVRMDGFIRRDRMHKQHWVLWIHHMWLPPS